jgi:hypothetical protein
MMAWNLVGVLAENKYDACSAPRDHREDAPVANGFVHQFRSDSAIDAAADGAYNPTSFAADFANTSNFLPYEFLLRRTTTGVIV